MEAFVILSEKKWNKSLIDRLLYRKPADWVLIARKDDFNLENINRIDPKYIFIPHWSYYIPEEIYTNYKCVVFHETDLPFGRGGSPIQNMIERGFSSTKITAIKAEKGLDTGSIYLKKDLSLLGTAEEIFVRANNVIEEMIIDISSGTIEPYAQKGEPTIFKRRTPEQSNIKDIDDIEKIFDYIRMLDADGYPKAFVETKNLRFEFSRASLKSDNSIIADVRIIKK